MNCLWIISIKCYLLNRCMKFVNAYITHPVTAPFPFLFSENAGLNPVLLRGQLESMENTYILCQLSSFKRNLINIYKYLREGCKGDGARQCQVFGLGLTRDWEHRMEKRGFPLVPKGPQAFLQWSRATLSPSSPCYPPKRSQPCKLQRFSWGCRR